MAVSCLMGRERDALLDDFEGESPTEAPGATTPAKATGERSPCGGPMNGAGRRVIDPARQECDKTARLLDRSQNR